MTIKFRVKTTKKSSDKSVKPITTRTTFDYPQMLNHLMMIECHQALKVAKKAQSDGYCTHHFERGDCSYQVSVRRMKV